MKQAETEQRGMGELTLEEVDKHVGIVDRRIAQGGSTQGLLAARHALRLLMERRNQLLISVVEGGGGEMRMMYAANAVGVITLEATVEPGVSLPMLDCQLAAQA